MRDNHPLNLNLRKTARCLSSVLAPSELEKLEKELRTNVRRLLYLGQSHLRFAKLVKGPTSWRQRVSRGYYSAYSASRAVRLEVTGTYSADVKDHKNIGDLPDGFPAVSRWKDFFVKFRADRNLADYDHSVDESALELTSNDYLERTSDFLEDSKLYLRSRGAL